MGPQPTLARSMAHSSTSPLILSERSPDQEKTCLSAYLSSQGPPKPSHTVVIVGRGGLHYSTIEIEGTGHRESGDMIVLDRPGSQRPAALQISGKERAAHYQLCHSLFPAGIPVHTKVSSVRSQVVFSRVRSVESLCTRREVDRESAQLSGREALPLRSGAWIQYDRIRLFRIIDKERVKPKGIEFSVCCVWKLGIYRSCTMEGGDAN